MQEHKSEEILMMFSIGPVQEFIAQARRTRDLWFGSYLLSELSIAGARKFRELGGRLVFPAMVTVTNSKQVEKMSAPNKILGIMDTDQPSKIAWQVRRAIQGKWKEYARAAEEKIGRIINIRTWDRQVSDLLEFQAAWTAMQGLNYDEALSRTEQLLAARKTLRDFKQNDPGAMYGEKKSSLDGGRESVWINHDRNIERLLRLGIKEHETLDAISVIKRLSLILHPDQERFLSVCETAFLPFQDQIRDVTFIGSAVTDYLHTVNELLGKENLKPANKLDSNSYDARLFYERRIEDYLEECVMVPKERKENLKDSIANELEQMYVQLEEKSRDHQFDFVRPTPYYAFLVADGDRMGEHLRNIKDEQSHIEFSTALSRFALEAVKIMKKHQGQLVYGGGDDVMAYLPVHTCLDAANELRKAFIDKMGSVISNPTLSVGIVIAHMLEPLEEVRHMAHEAERQAKRTRNALAVHFHKRGGGDLIKVAMPFDLHPVEQMKALRDHKVFFSAQFAYELRSMYQSYEEMAKGSSWLSDQKLLAELLWMEIERLAFKKKPERIDKETIQEQWIPKLKELYDTEKEPLERFRILAEQLILTIHLEKGGATYEETTASKTS
ncbi:type III-B CRISPR-associated protein Cas10/Cmr2 [Paenibacillus sp. BJ-4]|uniref:type III-B CRISPR-associated protein Cas10/Cmr2 n=1 Tax=Paenibacillus sp. BJ-4 TaxID=2878097 RepID=UPI001CEFF692|nr:type III-B CRISPR-associated protein Cas10/Cmr2 [Paenibacillus sp. BJ-4]